MFKWLKGIALPIAGLALFAMTPAAKADTIHVYYTGGPTADGVNWDYTYQVALDSQGTLAPPTSSSNQMFAVLYDYFGLVNASFSTSSELMARGWSGSASVNFTTTSPVNTSPPDSGSALNAEVYFTGSSTVQGDDVTLTNRNSVGTPGEVILGYLTVVSTSGNLSPTAGNVFVATQDYDRFNADVEGFTGRVRGAAAPLPSTAFAGLSLLSILGGFGVWKKFAAGRLLAAV